MTALGFAVTPDPRPGRPAFDAVIWHRGQVLDKRRFAREEAALDWARRRAAEILGADLEAQLVRLGYEVFVAFDPDLDWWGELTVEGRVVASTNRAGSREEALRQLAGEVGVPV